MTKKETIEIIEMINALYPKSDIKPNDITVDTWNMVLEGYTKQQIAGAVKSLMMKMPYVPHISEIIEEVKNVFTIERIKKKEITIIRVRYEDEIIPFTCYSKQQFDDLISRLKKMPAREEVLKLHILNLKENKSYLDKCKPPLLDRSSKYHKQSELEKFLKQVNLI